MTHSNIWSIKDSSKDLKKKPLWWWKKSLFFPTLKCRKLDNCAGERVSENKSLVTPLFRKCKTSRKAAIVTRGNSYRARSAFWGLLHFLSILENGCYIGLLTWCLLWSLRITVNIPTYVKQGFLFFHISEPSADQESVWPKTDSCSNSWLNSSAALLCRDLVGHTGPAEERASFCLKYQRWKLNPELMLGHPECRMNWARIVRTMNRSSS